MKRWVLLLIIFITAITNSYAQQAPPADSVIVNRMGMITPDSILQQTLLTALHNNALEMQHKQHIADSIAQFKADSAYNATSLIPRHIKNLPVDSLLLNANPLFIDLVYMGRPLKFEWNLKYHLEHLTAKPFSNNFINGNLISGKQKTASQIISELRQNSLTYITQNAAHLYAMRYDQLPDPSDNKTQFIPGKPLRSVHFVDDIQQNRRNKQLIAEKAKLCPWKYEARGLAQFSQNYISKNWYQGGNSNTAILGILTGVLNYDDKKNIQFDNNAEWRMGFNSVDNAAALRPLSVNDDIFKINSKLGIKAGGNWFYSGSINFATQFFNSYKSVTSTDLKTSFLSPVRLNIGVGLDYKYKKILSVMVAPVAYKYIYVKDTINPNPNLFGIKKGENHLSEIGSSLRAVLTYPITKEIQLDSKLSFYTNYEKVEIDWEAVCNFTINRFLTTRVSFNPRYDNTVILKNDEKAKLQFKQLLSIGFSHRFR